MSSWHSEMPGEASGNGPIEHEAAARQRRRLVAFVALAPELGIRGLGDVALAPPRSAGGPRLSFRLEEFPGVCFCYLAKAPGEDDHEALWLGEEIATGALARLSREGALVPDAAGTVWLALKGARLVATERPAGIEG
ncbi:MAG: hypothetical protein M0004_09610 [Actinomycetota bacterium]|nr:hypothetical protein [Actinomycetota bacterium]